MTEVRRFYESSAHKNGVAFLFRHRNDNLELARLHAEQMAQEEGFRLMCTKFLGTTEPPKMGVFFAA